jgi:DNA-binding transcriptional ArsR family regulator
MTQLAAVPTPAPEPAPMKLPDSAVLKALHLAMGHPLRLECLQRIAAADKPGASPRGLADVTGAPLGNVSYHVRTLRERKLILATKKVQRRGAIEHYYELGPRGKKVLEYLERLVADPPPER